MAFQARHRWIIQKLDEAFGICDESMIEAAMREDGCLEVVDSMLKAGGPEKIFFFFQPRDVVTPDGEVLHGTGPPELFVTDGETVQLRGMAVYILRASPKGDIDPSKSGDGLLTFGTVDMDLLQTFETTLSRLYAPMLEHGQNWGKATAEQTVEFLDGVHALGDNLRESLKSLQTGLELRKPDRGYDIEAHNLARLATEPECVHDFGALLEEWCHETEAYLDESDRGRFESQDAGPDTELEYWRRRMQRLSGIVEQLKGRECKAVIGVLTAVTKQQEDLGLDRARVFALLRRWKQIDMNITEAANEARDNVKYLATLERFIEPLYTETPGAILDTLPALVNAIKMIHTIARYYNTTERMTKLFSKITNQMVNNCKRNVNGTDSPDAVWSKPPQELVLSLEASLQLNEVYQEQYRLVKDKLLTMPKGKQFDFNEQQIFGKFDNFCRRVIKLVDLFSTIHQFQQLALHALEGMEPLVETFNGILEGFKAKSHDVLDFADQSFDHDYVEFNVQIAELETQLQQFINHSFDSITSIEASLNLLKQFQNILQRESLRHDLESKFTVIFHNYGLDLNTVQELYEKQRHSPPVPRNMPPVAGNIIWSRHLLKRIEEPMRKFESNPKVLATKESKKIVKSYNKVARTLVAFEYLWYQAWCKSIEQAKAGLQATLVIRHPETGRLFVNFDQEILQLVREAKCLDRMGIEIPDSAKMVLLQEERFKAHYNELNHALHEYGRVMDKIAPVVARLLTPHVMDLEALLKPSMVSLTWTSMNIDSFMVAFHGGLSRLEELINNINDIVENRIEKNLKLLTKFVMVDLPKREAFTLDSFVTRQQKHVAKMSEQQMGKNTEIENAVEDLVALVTAFPLDASSDGVSEDEVQALRAHYAHLLYRSQLNSTQKSLFAIKNRVASKGGSSGFLFVERPFFEVDVQLAVPSVRLSPSMDDVQRAINRASLAVLRSAQKMYKWGQQSVPEEERATLFDDLGQDVAIVKVVLLLSGTMQRLKDEVKSVLATFRKYDWLWKEDMELEYSRFMRTNPSIEDFEAELHKFMEVEAEIDAINPCQNIGALSLNTHNLKLQLTSECRQWKVQYSDKVHQQAFTAMKELMEYMRVTNNHLSHKVDDLDSLRYLISVLKEVRERESTIEFEVNPILDMYQMLGDYLPPGCIDQEEMDMKTVIRKTWHELVQHAEDVTDVLSDVQGQFKKQLIDDIHAFTVDAASFKKDFELNGPLVSGIKPAEAVERLHRFQDQLTTRERKVDAYKAGEELFGLAHTTYPDLQATVKQMGLADQLYGLYTDVLAKMEQYRVLHWNEVSLNIEEMLETINSFDARCRRMPKRLTEWEAYQILRKQISDFQDMVPIIQELSKSSIMPRHWVEVRELTGTDFDVESETFELREILECTGMLENKEEIEELTDGADKQLKIRKKLDEIREKYDQDMFTFVMWKSRPIPVLSVYAVVVEELEDNQLQLQGMLGMRHVTPFREEAQGKLTELSDTVDMLELWIKVQMQWQALESVFTGGDIAKQMPLEAKKFAKVDKDWIKIMGKAADTGNVVACCANEVLRNSLPVLYSELEKCQKSLDGYLEQKRGKFPRFYFVSNPVLLMILSKGSDPLQVLPYYEKIFDAISSVVHDDKDKTKVLSMLNTAGNDSEVIPFEKLVKCQGNVEDWLTSIESEMQRTMKMLCAQTAVNCRGELRAFVDGACGQFSLLGIQFNWTTDAQLALEHCKGDKKIMQETNKGQLGVLSEISSWCLTDLGTKLNRTKIETLVTIQVHQRDVFEDLTRLFKERKISGAGDFEWLKQARFYWQPENSDVHGEGACLISICDVDFKYSWEYLGCKDRLVITPLTDRCYITLSQALGIFFGGAPAGPAGTGKTETTKDMGRSLGVFVVVTNCSDQVHYGDMAKIFKGLCQAGLWGCFDEFNRIELPVLSVVAQQVLAITNAKRVGAPSFTFPGDTQVVMLKPQTGYFITMNPGYAGRQELPENLKALFRGVTMMVPDRQIIMKVKLCSVGYTSFDMLSKKFATLYRLCEEQLSKQKHYDFGLRNILSVLRTAGQTKRNQLDAPEELLMMTTLRDMNLSKMVADDTPLFLSLLKDLFPNVSDTGQAHTDPVMDAVKRITVADKKIPHPSWILKVNQLYDTTLVRHGIMLVGPSGAGKTNIFKTLREALAETSGVKYSQIVMNPKAIRPQEMFGETDKASGEWVTGIFAAIWAKCNDRARKDRVWIVCDGPVDAVWIENLNTVLDDNKLLTLANGDRMSMTDNVKLMFEVEDLRNASPATVSRAGIIYVPDVALDFYPVMQSWLQVQPEAQRKPLGAMFDRYIGVPSPVDVGIAFSFLRRDVKQVLNCTRVGMIEGMLSLLQSMLGKAELSDSEEDLQSELERIFLFCMAWSLGGLLSGDDRKKFDMWMRELCPGNMPQPPKEAKDKEAFTIFDFLVDLETLEWEQCVAPKWVYPAAKSSEQLNFSNLLVSTVDSTRAVYVTEHLHRIGKSVLMVGEPGTAKTTTAQLFFDSCLHGQLLKTINFSSATTMGMFQGTVEAELDKRGGKNFGPPGGKKMTVFLDDLGMPEVNEWGDQPTLEIVRQLVQSAQICFLDKDKRGDIKNIEDLNFIGAMNPPGSGKNDIPARLKRQFFIFNMLLPTAGSIDNIYGQMLRGRFPVAEHKKIFTDFVGKLTGASIKLWTWMKKSFLPTPQKFHYIFNLRDISRIFQGVIRTPKANITNEKVLLKLWRHESERVFCDKLTTLEDKKKFMTQLDLSTEQAFGKMTAKERADPGIFVDFLRDDEYDEDGVLVREAPKEYELSTAAIVRERVDMFAGLYNEENPATQMHLILFEEAMEHLLRLTRTLGTSRGNMLLVGVGGSGKQSLTRLASYISRHFTFQIALSKAYGTNSLLDDLRMLYKHCGQQRKTATFLFTEAEIKEEAFLEFINSILSTGEVAGLFPKDELSIMAAELRSDAIKNVPGFVDSPANLVKYFYSCVRDNLHVVLCMSPVGAKFAERARKFPGLINGCTIDWFLPWSADALVTVSRGYMSDFPIECESAVKEQVIQHMGTAHSLATNMCTEYFDRMRRFVYQTPKSFLSFLEAYKEMYSTKLAEVKVKERNVALGLKKLAEGGKDVEKMKLVLADQEVVLQQADKEAALMLSKLEISSMQAKKEADAVTEIKEGCEATASFVTEEKKGAEADLAKAQPYLDKAEAAVQSIKPNDLNELKKLGKPGDIIKLTFDCVMVLRMQPLAVTEQASVTMGIGKEKRTFDFILDSFPIAKAGMLADARFIQQLFSFSSNEKDKINDETIEFLQPYLDIEEFNPAVAKNASKAAEGLCSWVRAMVEYTGVAKVVRPKLEALALAEAKLEAAQMQLDLAGEKLEKVQGVLNELQKDFEEAMAAKAKIEANALATRKKMEQATSLIDGLGGERARWTEDQATFASQKTRLVGDCAIACAFVSYCGPFDQGFRSHLTKDKFFDDISTRKIPVTEGIADELTGFLVEPSVVADWNQQGLPTDSLSTANGILVTRSSRFPLLVDPQGQALNWILRREEERLPTFGSTTLADPRLRDRVEFCMSEGKALVLAAVEEEIDPMLTPLLEKQIIKKGKNFYITIADKLCEFNHEFVLYMTTRLANPHFSPELQARTTVVNFTVTQGGLAEQLLGRVIGKEQKALEEQLNEVLSSVAKNTKTLARLDAELLQRLTENDGNLLDDVELIAVLADTKKSAVEVKAALIAAEEMKLGINEKREQFRPVATRGAVLYFALLDFASVNCMYQTSLAQFLEKFEASMDLATKASLAQARVNNIIETMTYTLYRYVNRGLYEKDKLSFILMCLLKILQTAGHLTPAEVTVLLKGGAALDANSVRKNPCSWLPDLSWLSVVQVSMDCKALKGLTDSFARSDSQWKKWFECEDPEEQPIPDFEASLVDDIDGGAFRRMLIVRSVRDDRTILAVKNFIRASETVESGGVRLAAMGPSFVQPVTDTSESILDDMTAFTPTIYLLSAGADPTDSIEQLSKRKKQSVQCVSMGEGQEPVALKAINTAMVNGSWVLLQNCHLGLGFMDSMEALLVKIHENCNPDFRLYITSEPHPKFPIGLLHQSFKVTNEPPAGLKAGVLRSYTVMLDQEKLDRVDSAQWRSLVYAFCFLHSVVQERRKFGALGWCIPYEYNNSDLGAGLGFLEKHLFAGAISWPTVQYMVSEVVYGGKITDNLDRRLMNSYCEQWIGPPTLTPSFKFNPDAPVAKIPGDFMYTIPSGHDLTDFMGFVRGFPEIDSPEVSGMHPNADLTFRVKEVNTLLNTLMDTQPKAQAAEGGKSPDELVMEKCAELVSKMPEDYVEDAFKDRIVRGMGGLGTFAASRSPRCPRRRRILELRAHPAYLPLCSLHAAARRHPAQHLPIPGDPAIPVRAGQGARHDDSAAAGHPRRCGDDAGAAGSAELNERRARSGVVAAQRGWGRDLVDVTDAGPVVRAARLARGAVPQLAGQASAAQLLADGLLQPAGLPHVDEAGGDAQARGRGRELGAGRRGLPHRGDGVPAARPGAAGTEGGCVRARSVHGRSRMERCGGHADRVGAQGAVRRPARAVGHCRDAGPGKEPQRRLRPLRRLRDAVLQVHEPRRPLPRVHGHDADARPPTPALGTARRGAVVHEGVTRKKGAMEQYAYA
jgi:dynein heavy chain, axonemal